MTALFPGGLGATASHQYECSRAQCTAPAAWALLWRNPKIHVETRRKTWLACDAHLEYLREFLAAREFPLEVVPVSELEAQE